MMHRASTPASVGRAVSRRFLLRIVVLGAVVAPLLPAHADAQEASADIATPVERLNAALLTIMKSGERVSFQQRFETLVPIVEQTFDVPAVLQLSIGPRWAGLSADDQGRLRSAFRHYTVANYVANFNRFSGQSFVISPDIRSLGNGDRIVQTTITSPGEAGHTLGYVMRQTPSGWKAVDVLVDGAISRVAVHRSDFRTVLASGGSAALVAMLERKASDLSAGRLA